jgi:hypothetical protein
VLFKVVAAAWSRGGPTQGRWEKGVGGSSAWRSGGVEDGAGVVEQGNLRGRGSDVDMWAQGYSTGRW